MLSGMMADPNKFAPAWQTLLPNAYCFLPTAYFPSARNIHRVRARLRL